MKKRNELLLLLASLTLLACTETIEQPAPGVTAVYGDAATSQLAPYPSDRYTVADDSSHTGRRVSIPDTTPDLVNSAGGEETIAELEAMDGFSTTGGVIVTFDGPIDVSRIALEPEQFFEDAPPLRDASTYQAPGAPFHLLDIDPDSPDYGNLVGLVPRYWQQEADGEFVTSNEYTIIAMPAEPLRPATQYLFVVTGVLKAADGGPVNASESTSALLAGDDEYAQQVAAGIDLLHETLGRRPSIVLATAFTTTSIHHEMLALSSSIRAAPVPSFSAPWTVETPEESDGRVRFRAEYIANEYRQPLPDGRFVIGADGTPVPQGTENLEVFLAVSDANTAEPRTVVIYGHGLGGDKDGSWGTAQRLADLNVAVFAIDSPFHGSRTDPDGNMLDAVFSFFGIDPADQSFVIGRSRDNFRQMAADQLELVKIIGALGNLDILPPGNPDGIPDFDVSRILYIGHSFGSVQGPLIFGIAPEISHAVWNVGGAGLMMLLRDSGTFGILVNSLKPAGTPDGAVARFMAVAQAIVDPGDPLNYARFALREQPAGVPNWRPREVLMQEVIADTIVPNTTSRALARATGLQLIDPIEAISGIESVSGPVTGNLSKGVTGAISQFDLIHGSDVAVHGELIFAPEGINQYIEFFRTGIANEHATIPSPY